MKSRNMRRTNIVCNSCAYVAKTDTLKSVDKFVIEK